MGDLFFLVCSATAELREELLPSSFVFGLGNIEIIHNIWLLKSAIWYAMGTRCQKKQCILFLMYSSYTSLDPSLRTAIRVYGGGGMTGTHLLLTNDCNTHCYHLVTWVSSINGFIKSNSAIIQMENERKIKFNIWVIGRESPASQRPPSWPLMWCWRTQEGNAYSWITHKLLKVKVKWTKSGEDPLQ